MSRQGEHLVQEGIEASQRNDIERAEACFREALRLCATDPDALYNLAVIHSLRRDLDSALDLASRCIAASPAHPKAHYQRGMVRHAKGDLSGALADFEMELRSHPDDVEAILSRGATLSALGNKSEALASYERAVQLAPRDPRPYFNRGLHRSELDPDGAMLDFSAAIDRDPRKADAYLGRGFLLRAKGRKQEALSDFQASLRFGASWSDGNAKRVLQQVRRLVREMEQELGVASPPTPLSDLIREFGKARTKDSFARFLEAFRHAHVGVVVDGVPAGTVGEFTSTSEQPVSVVLSTDVAGRPVVLAFADPPAFARNFGAQFNSVMSGEAILQTVVQDPDCHGVRVNSAAEEVSVTIDRQTAASLLGAGKTTPAPRRRRWWELW